MATYDGKAIKGKQLERLTRRALMESALISKIIECGATNTYPVHLIANIYSEGTTFEANKYYSLTLHIYSAGGGTEEGILKIGYTSGASSTDNGELSAAWLCRSEGLPVDVVRVGVVRSSTGIGLFVLSLRKAFLYLLTILWNSAFKWAYLSFSPLLFASLLFTAICKGIGRAHV